MPEGAYATEAHAIWNLEEPSLPSDAPAIKVACILIVQEEISAIRDITQIIQFCLKDVKWHTNVCGIKMLS